MIPCYCCCSSVTQLCPNIYHFMNCSTPGFPVLLQLLELAQTHIHWVSETIWPLYPLSSPSPPAFNLSQHQGLFQWIGSASGGQSIGASASVLPMNIQDWFPLGLTGLISCGPRDSLESSPTPQFKSINSLVLSFLYSPTLASLVTQRVKHLPAMLETWVWSLVGKISWRREWLPTVVFLPGESHGWRSLVGNSLRGPKESDTTQRLHFHSHPYMTTGKTIALTRQTFVGQVTSLLFNILSRLVIAFLPRNKPLLISWRSPPLQWFWSPPKWSLSLFPLFPHLFAERDGTRCHDLSFLNVEF